MLCDAEKGDAGEGKLAEELEAIIHQVLERDLSLLRKGEAGRSARLERLI